jgi:glucan phosphoethanolaminetransferase (alkaline phosphatase superfamily)
MKMKEKYPLKIILLIIFAFFMSTIWWKFWIYSGLPGSPGLILKLFSFDGEKAYDAIHVEMFIISLIIMIFIFWFFTKVKTKYFRN